MPNCRAPVLRSIAAGLSLTLLIAAVLFAARAEAATIQTYSFIQDGYRVEGEPANQTSAVVQGMFSGVVDSSGFMTLGGLTDFEMNITIDHANGAFSTWHSVGMPSFFSFNTLSAPNPSGGNSTLAITASILTFGTSNLCVGITTAFHCAGSGVNGRYPLFFLSTSNFAQVTAVTPIPAPILLFGTALASLGFLRAIGSRRRLDPASAAA